MPGETATSTDWVGGWLGRGQNVFLLLTAALGVGAAWRAPPKVRWLLGVGFAGVALVLYSAPDLRFALGYSGVLVAAFCLRWGGVLRGTTAARARAPALGAAVMLAGVGLAFLGARVVRPTVDGDRGLAVVEPPRMTQPGPLGRGRIGDVDYYVPRDAFCWSAPLPCTAPSFIRSDTTLRDPGVGLDAGFAHR